MGRNAETLRESFARFGRGDVMGAMECFAAELEWREAEGHPLGREEAYRTPQEVLQNVFGRLGEFDEYRLEVAEFYECGDVVVVTGRYRGVYRPTGRRLDAQFAYVIRMREGKLVGFQQYTDTAQWRAVMGV